MNRLDGLLLSFAQQVNLLVYTLSHFNQSGLLGEAIIHGVDSTELATDCRLPLATLEINGKKIRIYNDLDCDCGKRHNKRDKSMYVIGYRLHTLTAIDVRTGHSFPLVSLLAPANIMTAISCRSGPGWPKPWGSNYGWQPQMRPLPIKTTPCFREPAYGWPPAVFQGASSGAYRCPARCGLLSWRLHDCHAPSGG
ncbi:MAG: hypothetical protein RBT36_04975 [Desulfobulbus sp.]|nr:hypothetical protein [Desulfobulbus sp.]